MSVSNGSEHRVMRNPTSMSKSASLLAKCVSRNATTEPYVRLSKYWPPSHSDNCGHCPVAIANMAYGQYFYSCARNGRETFALPVIYVGHRVMKQPMFDTRCVAYVMKGATPIDELTEHRPAACVKYQNRKCVVRHLLRQYQNWPAGLWARRQCCVWNKSM